MKKYLLIILIICSFCVVTEVSADDTSVRIGIIDTGFSNKHNLIDENKLIIGKNYINLSQDTTDYVGHGTAIVSIILGTTDGEIPPLVENAKIVPLVFYSKYQTGVVINGGVTAISQAIYDAIDVYNCKVINISSGITINDKELEKAINYAEEHGVIVVSAVGNSNKTQPDKIFYPAFYDTVIGVGSYDGTKVADFSQRGENVFVLANGTDVEVLGIKNSEVYKTVSGSSYSVAYVSALAASLLEEYSHMTPAEFREVLRYSSQDICEIGYDIDSGYGIIDKEKAFEVIGDLQNEILIEYKKESFAKINEQFKQIPYMFEFFKGKIIK